METISSPLFWGFKREPAFRPSPTGLADHADDRGRQGLGRLRCPGDGWRAGPDSQPACDWHGDGEQLDPAIFHRTYFWPEFAPWVGGAVLSRKKVSIFAARSDRGGHRNAFPPARQENARGVVVDSPIGQPDTSLPRNNALSGRTVRCPVALHASMRPRLPASDRLEPPVSARQVNRPANPVA